GADTGATARRDRRQPGRHGDRGPHPGGRVLRRRVRLRGPARGRSGRDRRPGGAGVAHLRGVRGTVGGGRHPHGVLRGRPGRVPARVRGNRFLLVVHPARAAHRALVQGRSHLEPGLLPDRGAAVPGHHRVGRTGPGDRIRRGRRPDCARPGRRVQSSRKEVRTMNETTIHHRMNARTYWRGALAVAGRTLRTTFRNPALLMPPLVAPLIFFAVIGAGLGALGKAPGFDFPGGYTSFSFVFILLNSASFAAVFAGLALAQDLETGFSRRLMLAVGRRSALVVGYALTAVVRVSMGIAAVFAV